MFIVPGRTEQLILLSIHFVCSECFIHLFSSGVQGSYSRKQAVRTIEQRSYVRPASQVRYDLFTERVANGNRIVGTIRRQCC